MNNLRKVGKEEEETLLFGGSDVARDMAEDEIADVPDQELRQEMTGDINLMAEAMVEMGRWAAEEVENIIAVIRGVVANSLFEEAQSKAELLALLKAECRGEIDKAKIFDMVWGVSEAQEE